MAGVLHKLLRKQLHQRISACFNHQRPLDSVASSVLHQPLIHGSKVDDRRSPSPTSGSSAEEKITHYNGFQIYPTFSFAYLLNPISASGLEQFQSLESEPLDSDVSRMVWADSVKKKRKRKMNKHKLKKLRKRLRRHS